jgi:hypothetical protein
MTALFVAGLYQKFDVSEIPQMKILYKQLIFFSITDQKSGNCALVMNLLPGLETSKHEKITNALGLCKYFSFHEKIQISMMSRM